LAYSCSCSNIIGSARARTSVENLFALLLFSIGSIHTCFGASGKQGAVHIDARVEAGKVLLDVVVVADAVGADGPVKLGVRPEHMELDDDGSLHVTVKMTELLGANTLFHGKLTNHPQSFTISPQGVHPMKSSGQKIRFSVQAGQAHVFDATNGLRRTG
jgi:ABC-type sugar transport system ATPase subunit